MTTYTLEAVVNWVKNDEYRETQSEVLNGYFTYLWNSGKKEIYFYDPEVSDDQPDEYLRVLDDAPDTTWDEFFEHASSDGYHRIARKKQKDGTTLLIVRENYPGVTELPPLYLLVKE
tara:strand:+ start:5287 stop:5637 length:351 start_codon:yes stop_codon:yes gene_type:complete